MKRLALIAMLLCAGCTTSRPHTAYEKQLLDQFVTETAVEAVVTSCAMYNNTDVDIDYSFVFVKTALYGGAWMLGNAYPDTRKYTYTLLSYIGYGVIGLNLFNMADQ